MNTSDSAIQQLQQALTAAQQATDTIDNLIAAHDYQDVASLVAQAASTLLEAARLLMESQDEAALDALENADDLIESVYNIIDGDLED